MKRFSVAILLFMAALVMCLLTLIGRGRKPPKEATLSAPTTTQLPTRSARPATTLVNPEDVIANGIEPQNSKPMTRSQWSAFLTYPQNEISFQQFKNTDEYKRALGELQAIGSRMIPTGTLSSADVGAIRVYLHHRYYGFRAAALEVVEKGAKTDKAKDALFPDVSRLLEDVSPTVRQAAIEAAVALKASGAVPLLTKQVQTDPEPAVQKKARRAIQRLSP